MPPKSKTPKKRESEKQTPVVEEFQQVDLSTKDVRTVVLMLDSPEAALVCKACDALHKYIEKGADKCQELKEFGAVPPLVRLLSSADRAVQCYAVMCLASMATNSSVRDLLLKCECIAPLLRLLDFDEELVTQERASFTLAQLSVEYTFKIQLHQHSAQEPLIKLLTCTDPDVQRNCIQTLSLLVENYQARPAVLETNGIPILLDLLESDYPLIQELALKTLHMCMRHGDCRKAVVSGNGLEKIVSFLGQNDTSDLHGLAVTVLALCLEEADCLIALQSSNCLQQLLSNIKESSSADMKRSSALALAKAAKDTVNLKLLHEQEAEKTFLALLSHEDDGVVMAGCDGVTAMCALNVSRQLIAAQDGLSALVQNTQKQDGQVRVCAVRAIAAIINGSPANCKLLGTSGGTGDIVHLLSDSECGCREFATNCITSMAPDSSLRSELISEGAIGALIYCLSFADSAVQSGACVAMGMLACDSNARLEITASESGVLTLLTLLQSSVEAVVQNAIWTISVCAQSPSLSEAICRLGGLELIQKLLMSSNSHKATATNALNKLLCSNLSAKYWITGRLTQNDVITNMEFFDAGLLLASSHSFIPLAELVKEPLNKNQAILTVNLLAKPQPIVEEKPETSNQLDTSNSTVSTTGGRSKSRQQGGGATEKGKSKRGRSDRESESRISEESVEPTPNVQVQPGLLPVDSGLWTHITYTHNHIQTLSSVKEQVVELAKYVCDQLGGVIARSECLSYELPAGVIQYQQMTNLLPLGQVTVGSFQHRALLFKVLCDQLGIGCSLVRGEYGRHWNEVWLMDKQITAQYLVNLTFEPGKLMLANTSCAVEYQRLC